MTPVASLAVLAALLAGGVLGYLLLRSRSSAAIGTLEERLRAQGEHLEISRSRADALESDLSALRETNATLGNQGVELRTRLEAEQRSATEKLEALAQAETRLKESFQALSAEALKSSNESFLTLARTQMEKFQESSRTDLDQRKLAVENLVKPIAETLLKVDGKLQEVEKGRVASEASLREHLTNVHLTQLKLKTETENLVKALRAPNVRGRWGEIQLKRVVEIAGMLEYCDFVQQTTVDSGLGGGRRRPDLVVRLPSGRCVVVDSKVPLSHYLEALEAPDEETRVSRLRDHAAQVRRHLTELSGKGYWDSLEDTPEFVVLFLPGETFFSAALEQDPSLIEYGVEQRVILATPTTLIALLKAVAYGWRQEQIAENAKEISELGRVLYERVRTLATHMVSVGKGLGSALDAYNRSVGSLERTVLPAARKFRDLRAAAGDDIPVLEPVDKMVRIVTAAELLSGRGEDAEGDLPPAPAGYPGIPPGPPE